MKIFEQITRSPEHLRDALNAIPTTDAPWDLEFEKRICADCARENCWDCPEKTDRIMWWLLLEIGPKLLTRKGPKCGWFSPAKKQDLTDKLGPIEHEAEALISRMCDGYCVKAAKPDGLTQEDLDRICADCPMTRLAELIGV